VDPRSSLKAARATGKIYYEVEFRERIKAAQRMHHTQPIGAGTDLGYAPGGASSTGQKLWTWQGINCHPADPNDPALAPYGAAFAAEYHRELMSA
jgi:hypothetical protein